MFIISQITVYFSLLQLAQMVKQTTGFSTVLQPQVPQSNNMVYKLEFSLVFDLQLT